MMLSFPSPPSPSPPPPTISTDNHSPSPSLLIISGIIAFVITASASIHLLLRLISRSRSPLPPLPTSIPPNNPSSEDNKLISSLPIFTLASSSLKSRSLDCAVCLSNFRPHDELRLLPACRHAFHSQCVDTWLKSTPSCPLCRASILLPLPPSDPSRSASFRVEIGSVSRRMAEGIQGGHSRSYSLGSSFEYLVEEEVETVVGKPENAETGGSGRRGWIRDCVDRIASSASSSFNSLRFSGRFGGHQVADPASQIAAGGVGRSWDLEANGFVAWEEESGFSAFYRWLAGV